MLDAAEPRSRSVFAEGRLVGKLRRGDVIGRAAADHRRAALGDRQGRPSPPPRSSSARTSSAPDRPLPARSSPTSAASSATGWPRPRAARPRAGAAARPWRCWRRRRWPAPCPRCWPRRGRRAPAGGVDRRGRLARGGARAARRRAARAPHGGARGRPRHEPLPLLLEQVDRAVVLLGEEDAELAARRPATAWRWCSPAAGGWRGGARRGAPRGRRGAGLAARRRRPGSAATCRARSSGWRSGAGGAKGYAHVGALAGARGGGLHDRLRGRQQHRRRSWAPTSRSGWAPPRSTRRCATRSPRGRRGRGLQALAERRSRPGATRCSRILTRDDARALVRGHLDPARGHGGRPHRRVPAPLREGPIWEALLASTALAGMFPPRERDGHRLVDGLALVPVPVGRRGRGRRRRDRRREPHEPRHARRLARPGRRPRSRPSAAARACSRRCSR